MLTYPEGVVFTHRGRRQRNEDNGCVARIDDTRTAVIVCDGMGGHLAGDYASQTATAVLAEALSAGIDPVEAIESINGRLHQESLADSTKSGMGTTLVAAIVSGGQYTMFNVGDSRGYLLLADGRIEQITRDHSYVAEAIAAGELTPETASSSNYKNALTRAIGTDPSVRVDVFGPAVLPSGATLVLCTDGVYKVLADERIAELLSSKPDEHIARVAIEAFEAGSDDNTTVAALWAGQELPRASRATQRSKVFAKSTAAMDKLAARADAERKRRAAGGTSSGASSPARSPRRLLGGVLALSGLALIGAAALPLLLGTPRPSDDGATESTSALTTQAGTPELKRDPTRDAGQRGERGEVTRPDFDAEVASGGGSEPPLPAGPEGTATTNDDRRRTLKRAPRSDSTPPRERADDGNQNSPRPKVASEQPPQDSSGTTVRAKPPTGSKSLLKSDTATRSLLNPSTPTKTTKGSE